MQHDNLPPLRAAISSVIQNARAESPMVQSLTNFVTMSFVANAQLAVGGSAAMIGLPDEPALLGALSRATYIKLGTLMPVSGETLPNAAKAAVEQKKPWVLDPVSSGLGELRGQVVATLKAYPPTVVRGNASEIITLARQWDIVHAGSVAALGVETKDNVDAARDAAVALARGIGGVVAVSGDNDLITDGDAVYRTPGGSPLLTRVTGGGCSLGGVIAVYCTVGEPLVAALAGHLMYNRAGELAASRSAGPGSFQPAFLDALYSLDADTVAASALLRS
jgi:hydroxyethylthiazole kinase